jgi:hypothetical protein
MRIIRNERRIRVLGGIGQYVPWIALLVLGAGLLISYLRPEWMLAMVVSVAIGVVLSVVGGRFAERYAGPLAHHDALAKTLKGLDDRHVLVQYILPAPHVLLDPGGCTVLVVKSHGGEISFEDGRFRHRQKGRIFRQLAGLEGIGLLHSEAEEQAARVDEWLQRNVEGVAVPIQVAIVFVNPKAKLDAADSPIPALFGKKVKPWLRGPGRRKVLRAETYRRMVGAVEEHSPSRE